MILEQSDHPATVTESEPLISESGALMSDSRPMITESDGGLMSETQTALSDSEDLLSESEAVISDSDVLLSKSQARMAGSKPLISECEALLSDSQTDKITDYDPMITEQGISKSGLLYSDSAIESETNSLTHPSEALIIESDTFLVNSDLLTRRSDSVHDEDGPDSERLVDDTSDPVDKDCVELDTSKSLTSGCIIDPGFLRTARTGTGTGMLSRTLIEYQKKENNTLRL